MEDVPYKPSDQPAFNPSDPPAEGRKGPPSDEDLWNVLKTVFDPELHMNIVDLGLVYGVDIKDRAVTVQMTLTTPGCPYGPYLLHNVDQAVKSVPGVESADIEVVWTPPWSPERMTEEARLELGFDL
jgi:metal-sulfur cluster biosynthetic enzyme